MIWQGDGVSRMERYCHNADDPYSLNNDNAYCSVEDKDGNICYAYPKETSRKIVVKHLGEELPISELFTSKVITDDVLRRLDEEVIRPNFELPSQDSMADVEEIFDNEEE
jgi:hypothetical protein